MQEIERKFLLRSIAWKAGATATRLTQGYLCVLPERTVRIRRAGERGFVTIKGRGSGIGHPEFEYEIPLADAEEMLATLCQQPLIDKTRYELWHAGHLWEIDEFHGDNAGLVLAEIELAAEDDEFVRPDWLGEEVTGDHRYSNASLVTRPYSSW
jgi:adenylate cyclase